MKTCKFLIIFSLIISFSAFAAGNSSIAVPFTQIEKEQTDPVKLDDQKRYTITEVELEELAPVDVKQDKFNESWASVKEVIMIVDQLIAIGKKIWPIIEANRPVINMDFVPTSVFPLKIKEQPEAMYQMYDWKAPTSRRYRLSYKNFFGVRVIDFIFSVHYQYNGTLEGKGRYLTGISIVPNYIYVFWGFRFDANSMITNIANRGTQKNPVAGATIEVEHKVSNFLNEAHSRLAFHVTGTGEFVPLDL